MVETIALGVVTFLSLLLVLFFLSVSYQLSKVDKSNYEKNRRRVKKKTAPLLGAVESRPGNIPDESVHEGLAVSKNGDTWIRQGKFSDDAINLLKRVR